MYIENIIPKVPQVGGWIEVTLGVKSLTRVREYIQESASLGRDARGDLAGNLTEERSLQDRDNWLFDKVLLPAIEEYESLFPSVIGEGNYGRAVLTNMWVNYQNKYEFNPMHRHAGAYSFTIWIKVPTDWRDEHNLPFVKYSNRPSSSNFEFSYTDLLGSIQGYQYLLDSSLEGQMLLFPSKMPHQVYPFYTSDEVRISVSGNIHIC